MILEIYIRAADKVIFRQKLYSPRHYKSSLYTLYFHDVKGEWAGGRISKTVMGESFRVFGTSGKKSPTVLGVILNRLY